MGTTLRPKEILVENARGNVRTLPHPQEKETLDGRARDDAKRARGSHSSRSQLRPESSPASVSFGGCGASCGRVSLRKGCKRSLRKRRRSRRRRARPALPCLPKGTVPATNLRFATDPPH